MSIETREAARLIVTRTAIRFMQDTDDDFYGELAKWLDHASWSDPVERDYAYRVSESYLRNRDRLQRRLP